MSSKPRWALVSFYCYFISWWDQGFSSLACMFYPYGEHLVPPCGSYGELQRYDTLFSTTASEQLPLCSMTPLVSGHVTDKHYFIKCFKSNTNPKKNAKQFLEPLINKNTSDEQKIVFMQIQTLSLRLYQLIARVIP